MPTSSSISYSTAEAAYYARLHSATVRAWVKGRLDLGCDESEELNFHEFVQLLAVRELRLKGISLGKIRATMQYIKEDCGIKYPFASLQHTTYTEDKNLFVQIQGESGIFTATGKDQLQLNFPPIVELYMSQLHFDDNGLATKFEAFQHADQKITIAPDEYYGQPVIAGTGYTVSALQNAVDSEGGFAAAAKVYGVPQTMVEAAVRYIDHLSPKPARSAS